MKLPNIPVPKPHSANSHQPQQRGVISNLEKTLITKFKEYDELSKINNKSHSQSSTGKNSKILSTSLALKNNPESMLLQFQPTNFNEETQSNQKTDQETQPLILNQGPFITCTERNLDPDSSDSENEKLIQKTQKLKKDKQMIAHSCDESEMGELNKLIYQTQTYLDDSFEGIAKLKKNIDLIIQSQQALGSKIDSSLLENMNRQYKQLLELQKESQVRFHNSQVIEEFEMEEYKKSRVGKMPTLRSGSVKTSKKPRP